MMLGPLLLLAAQTAVPAPVLMFPPPKPPANVMAKLPVTSPTPRQPLLSLFSRDDFPAALEGKKAPLVADLKLFIGAAGRVETCAINRRTADDVLIVATCNILARRARFLPAADADGQPTSGVVDVQIDWDVVFRNFRQR